MPPILRLALISLATLGVFSCGSSALGVSTEEVERNIDLLTSGPPGALAAAQELRRSGSAAVDPLRQAIGRWQTAAAKNRPLVSQLCAITGVGSDRCRLQQDNLANLEMGIMLAKDILKGAP